MVIEPTADLGRGIREHAEYGGMIALGPASRALVLLAFVAPMVAQVQNQPYRAPRAASISG